MPEHFKAIGLDVTTPEKLKALAYQAIERGFAKQVVRKELPEGVFLWDLGRGLQVWVLARRQESGEEEYEIVSALPGFLPEQTLHVHAYRIGLHHEREGEVLLKARMADGLELRMALLNLYLHDKHPTAGLNLDLHACALALQGECWSPQRETRHVLAQQPGEREAREVESMLVQLDRDAHHDILGSIERVQEITNFHSGSKLFVLYLKTQSILLPVIAPQALFDTTPQQGDRFHGTVWLQAQLQEKTAS